MFDGGYVLAQGFPVPARKRGQGIESPFDMMIEQAMTYHTISHRGSIILKGSHTALVPILVDGIGTLDQSEEVQWHLIGKKPKLVQVDLTDESKRIEGYYLTDVEFTTEDPNLSWEAIDRKGLEILPVKSIQELSGKRMFVGHFSKAQVLLGTKEAGYENVETSDAKLVKGNVVDFGQAINIAMGTNFGTAGMFNITGSTTIRRTKYDNTPKQVPALIGDQLRNRRSRPHILYDVEKMTGWMIPEACVILYLMHRWASLQEPPLVTDDQQEAPEEPSSSQLTGRYQPSDSRQEDPLELQKSPLLKYMPFIGASCDGGKKAADAIYIKFSQLGELPKYIRSVEKPEEPVYVANIVVRMYLTIDSLIEHQKSKKPGFLTRQRNRPYMWGYELTQVAELNKAHAKEVRIDKARSGGWYDLTEPKSEIAILFGNKFGDLIKYDRGHTLCHCWENVPIGNYFLSAESEALKYILGRLDQRGLPKLFLSKHSGINKCEHQKCENKAWPCCNMALQLKSTAPRVIIEGKEGEAAVIGKAVTKLKKRAEKPEKDFQISKRRRLDGSVEPQGVRRGLTGVGELLNGGSSEETFHEGAECDGVAEPEECDSLDDAEYLSCDE